MSQYVVHREVRIKAEPQRVWKALTDPEQTQKYFFHCRVRSNWQVGGDISFKGRMFYIIPVEMHGRIEAIEPGRLLKYTLHNRGSSSQSTVTDTLNYQDGETVLSISDDVGDGEGAQKRFERSKKGWDKVLNGLKHYLEAH
jgi:uncharacterized protein YndB with AHSA1/START domain